MDKGDIPTLVITFNVLIAIIITIFMTVSNVIVDS